MSAYSDELYDTLLAIWRPFGSSQSSPSARQLSIKAGSIRASDSNCSNPYRLLQMGEWNHVQVGSVGPPTSALSELIRQGEHVVQYIALTKQEDSIKFALL